MRPILLADAPNMEGYDFTKHGLYLAGWSRSRGQMVAAWIEQQDEAAGFAMRDATGQFIITYAADIAPGEDVPCESKADFVTLGRRLTKHWRQHRTEAAGGELLVAEVTRDRAVIEPAWDLDRDAPVAAPAQIGGTVIVG